ncbi:Putative transcriptional regulator (plasmid) [Sinorhizobium fredii HH103]|uniref:Transcriptional regulator n=1 Tax=Sinorhizobium fredii (strain HH103) TaxID=1117943 RepID=G9AJ82_SINF1|nr:GntR family transcriptional regulator [Sinorhizobium fredii]CCF01114.1 Putative transcriptional regulator [Sinorhizobium fredii HH103]
MHFANKTPPAARTGQKKDAAMTSEEMHEALFKAITEHQILPGTKLPEEELAEAFGVSRTRIRELLQRLSYLGIVKTPRHRSAYVAKPSEADARDVFQARRVLESGMIPYVIKRFNDKDEDDLRKLLRLEHDALNSKNRNRAISCSGQFHIRLCQVINNKTLLETLRVLVSQTSLILAVYPPSGRSSCDCEHHATLMDRIVARDVGGAVAALVHDLDAVEQSTFFTHARGKTTSLKAILSLNPPSGA